VINELGVLFDTNSAGLSTLGLQIWNQIQH
jgi:hypothetical protein